MEWLLVYVRTYVISVHWFVTMVAAEREDGRLKVEIKRAHSELEDIKEQMNVYEVGWLV